MNERKIDVFISAIDSLSYYNRKFLNFIQELKMVLLKFWDRQCISLYGLL